MDAFLIDPLKNESLNKQIGSKYSLNKDIFLVCCILSLKQKQLNTL
jgi:hypothetical protein